MVNIERNKKAFDWQSGKHGIQIEFRDKNGKYFKSGPILSRGAYKCNEWLSSYLIQTMGFKGNIEDVLDNVRLTTFELYRL